MAKENIGLKFNYTLVLDNNDLYLYLSFSSVIGVFVVSILL